MMGLLGLPGGDQRQRCVALAGLYQATALVQTVARTGSAPPEALRVSLGSVLRLDADSTLAVFGGLADLRLGFETLISQLGRQPGSRDLEISRYASHLIVLERTLARQPRMLASIADSLQTAAALAAVEGPDQPVVIEMLADLYRATLSTLSPRIMVSGEPAYLAQDDNARLIRALLLAAVRATVLWRQVGGSRRRLLLTRRELVALARAALTEPVAGDGPLGGGHADPS